MKILAINMSGVLHQEGFDVEDLLDFRHIEGTCCYCCEEAAEELSSKIPYGDACWIDTGDYHYLSYFRARKCNEAFDLILFDNHTDDFDICGTLSCGNWVTALKQECGCTVQLIRKAEDYTALPGKNVFVSIDLDVLREQDFRTNWDQGGMKLEELLQILKDISLKSNIVAIDICGGTTESKGATGEDLSINYRTRNLIKNFINQEL